MLFWLTDKEVQMPLVPDQDHDTQNMHIITPNVVGILSNICHVAAQKGGDRIKEPAGMQSLQLLVHGQEFR